MAFLDRLFDRIIWSLRWRKMPAGFGIIALAAVALLPMKTAVTAEEPLDRLSAIVQVDAVVPESARTAGGLGTRRTGTGVVIDDDGLILTVGYVILEAIDVSVRQAGGEAIPAAIVAYDHESGFGLIRTALPIEVEPMSLGNASSLPLKEPLLVASKVGRLEAKGVFLVDRRPFAGYWEYLLEDALFTAPPHGRFGGAALINRQGELVGIGSLILQDAAGEGRKLPANMFIPIDDLKPILAELIEQGRRAESPNPWLGVFLEEYRGRIFVTRVAPDSPAKAAGMNVGDLILGIDGDVVDNLADFYRDLWRRGEPGVDVPLDVVRGGLMSPTIVKSGDRYQYLKLDPSF